MNIARKIEHLCAKGFMLLRRYAKFAGLIPKKRIFVRELSGLSFSLRQELEQLRKIPRVIKGRDIKLKGGPQYFHGNILTPKDGRSQLLSAHFAVFAPGGRSEKHGHMNETIFYILDGKGHEIHDGVRHDWEAGDVVVVGNSCVHQHFNDDLEHPARAIAIKSKSLYLFMNLLMQDEVERQPASALPDHAHFEPTYFPE